ncbi:excisionase [Carbonactinospora thermoautotrophica]|uniref:Excisionase n=1 Tax=Carbonactinospora thermoautotrophica TaxID=1469144 RepID=A0A132NCE5_9ACTN|nr:helix-turn-helix domain-containing protein [Carbonactinospora thermoautotrophica]KWW97914.1 excisionase [Carbonactinospora thermoautotrophica]KWX07656.1 excisionase [Carbonactinospora thermoautotrophica]
MQPERKSQRLLTVPEVAAVLRVGRSKVYDLIRTKQLPSVKLGKYRRIPAEAVETLVTTLLEDAA